MAVSYWPTPDGEIETVEAPTVAKPSTTSSGSTGPRGASLPRRSWTLFANCDAVSFWRCAVGSGPVDPAAPPRPAGPAPFPVVEPIEAPAGPTCPVQARL